MLIVNVAVGWAGGESNSIARENACPLRNCHFSGISREFPGKRDELSDWRKREANIEREEEERGGKGEAFISS